MGKNAETRLERLFGGSSSNFIDYSSFGLGPKDTMIRELDIAKKVYSLVIFTKNNLIGMQFYFEFFRKEVFNFRKPVSKSFFGFSDYDKVIGIATIKPDFKSLFYELVESALAGQNVL